MGSNHFNRSSARSSVVATNALRGKQRGKSRAGIWAVVMLVCLALAQYGVCPRRPGR